MSGIKNSTSFHFSSHISPIYIPFCSTFSQANNENPERRLRKVHILERLQGFHPVSFHFSNAWARRNALRFQNRSEVIPVSSTFGSAHLHFITAFRSPPRAICREKSRLTTLLLPFSSTFADVFRLSSPWFRLPLHLVPFLFPSPSRSRHIFVPFLSIPRSIQVLRACRTILHLVPSISTQKARKRRVFSACRPPNKGKKLYLKE